MKTISRRNFIKNAGGAGFALWLGISVKGSPRIISSITKAGNFTPFILVESDGTITIFNIKPEMGQGTFQSIPSLIAEEFEVSLEQIVIRQTNGEKVFGAGQSAGGSSSVRNNYTTFRKVGASAREVFIKAASQQFLTIVNSYFISKLYRSNNYIPNPSRIPG